MTTSLLDCNLPELLACDLEASKDIFTAKQLTAGVPLSPIYLDNGPRAHSLQNYRSGQTFSCHSRSLVMPRVKSLENIGQHEKTLPWDEEPHKEFSGSDTASFESSGYLEMPSIKTRPPSTATPATSITSDSNTPSSSPLYGITEKHPGSSWMDLGNEGEDEESNDNVNSSAVDVDNHTKEEPKCPTRRNSTGHISPKDSLSKRRNMADSRAMSLDATVNPVDNGNLFGVPYYNMNRKSRPSPLLPESLQAKSKTPWPFPSPPARRSSIMKHPQLKLQQSLGDLPSQPATDRMGKAISPVDEGGPPPVPRRSSQRDHETTHAEKRYGFAPCDRCRDIPEDDEPANDTVPERVEQQESLGMRPTSHVNIEDWLDSTLGAFSPYPQATLENSTSRMPLPPEVVETLRISVACFPETMLLCSSLSIETIRGHSRKFKYQAANLGTTSALSGMEEPSLAKESKWKRFASVAKRGNSVSHTRNTIQKRAHDTEALRKGDSLLPSSQGNSPEWIAIKHIFPSGTDYLCDALYAHLVAYNYITALCPRGPLTATARSPGLAAARQNAKTPDFSTTPMQNNFQSPTTTTTSGTPHRLSESNRIPRKAASFLGLHNGPCTTTATATPTEEEFSRDTDGHVRTHVRNKKSFAILGITGGMAQQQGDNSNRNSLINSDYYHQHQRSNTITYNSHSPNPFSPLSPSATTTTTAPLTPYTPVYGAAVGSAAGGAPSNHGHSNSSSNNEQTLLDLRLGLARCVARLVGTLRLTGQDHHQYYQTQQHGQTNGGAAGMMSSEDGHEYYCSLLDGSGEERGLGGKQHRGLKGVDPLFMRALCEIVRCGEER